MAKFENTSPLPRITAMQYLVLAVLPEGEFVPGRVIREEIARRGEPKTGPGFYQLMARLEESGFVEGQDERKVVAGQFIKERSYQITGLGIGEREKVVAFVDANRNAAFLPSLMT